MKVSNQAMINFYNSGIMEKKLPLRLAFAISVNAKQMAPAVEVYEKQRVELLEKHGDDKNKFFEEINELLSAEAEVAITEVESSVFDSCDSAAFDAITATQMSAIGFMIK